VSQPLLIEHDDGVDRVTLNRPESLNALVLCSRSEEFSEGIRAFLEKRKPVYIKR
jgi:enoyl-CoA hydratase/carnithine racemase